VQIRALEIRAAAFVAGEQSSHAVERRLHDFVLVGASELRGGRAGGPCREQGRAQRQHRPARRERCARRMEKRGVGIPPVVELFPEGRAKPQYHLHDGPRRETAEGLLLRGESRGEPHAVRGLRRQLQHPER
jgi:hypothetical protein